MRRLVLGPLLRYVGDGCATVWVETDGPGEVEVLGCAERTFTVAGHSYALVVVTGLPRTGSTPYDVRLDGEPVWPLADRGLPPSVIRTRCDDEPVRLAFGSCRVAGPLDDPGRGVDALHALAERMRRSDPDEWPHALLLVGDQVYADENLDPATRGFLQRRRDTGTGTGPEVADLEEYTRLYRNSWSPDPVRWLLSTVPTAMVFDDHDIRDDWNTSRAWREAMRRTDWWQERVEAGLTAYWLYQHLGNLSPEDLAADELYARLRTEPDGQDVLRDHARRADGGGPARWSYARDLGGSRLVVLDSRCGRVLAEDRRDMLDESGWRWLEQELRTPAEHLLLATSLPFLLPPAIHALEQFDEALAGGAWGSRFARLGERLRQAADLEHWAAFGSSFARMTRLLVEVGSEKDAPETITFLSGDVHFAYLARARLPGLRSRLYQAVCSPLRNPLPAVVSLGQRLACSPIAGALGRALARSAGAVRPELRWCIEGGPAFGNELATLDLDGRHALLTVERALPGPRLARSFRYRLS